MPTRDKFHYAVRIGLEKQGWQITADPLYIEFGGVDMYIDLAADTMLGAEKDGRKIAVEIKSFIAPSLLSEFHTALGQFINYRTALQVQDPERQLYLAVTDDVYDAFFTLPFAQVVREQQQLRVIVYNVIQEEVVAWHE